MDESIIEAATDESIVIDESTVAATEYSGMLQSTRPQIIKPRTYYYQQKIKCALEVNNYKCINLVSEFCLERQQVTMEESTIAAAEDAGMEIFMVILKKILTRES